MISVQITVIFSILVSSVVVAQACYYPDGTLVIAPDFKPCHTGRTSMCCATNRTGPDVNSCEGDDTCLQQDSQTFWRESCTDPNWGPGCLQFCLSGIGMDTLSIRMVVEYSWCRGWILCCQ
jgi:hypothetical protein